MIVTPVTLITSVAKDMWYLKEITAQGYGARFLLLMMRMGMHGLKYDETHRRGLFFHRSDGVFLPLAIGKRSMLCY